MKKKKKWKLYGKFVKTFLFNTNLAFDVVGISQALRDYSSNV